MFDRHLLLAAIDEYMEGHEFSIAERSELSERRIEKFRNGLAASSDWSVRPATPRDIGRSLSTSAPAWYVSSEFLDDSPQADLAITLRTTRDIRMVVNVPASYLTPSVPLGHPFLVDEEHSIAERLVVWLDETLFRHSSTELKRATITEL